MSATAARCCSTPAVPQNRRQVCCPGCLLVVQLYGLRLYTCQPCRYVVLKEKTGRWRERHRGIETDRPNTFFMRSSEIVDNRIRRPPARQCATEEKRYVATPAAYSRFLFTRSRAAASSRTMLAFWQYRHRRRRSPSPALRRLFRPSPNPRGTRTDETKRNCIP